MALGPDRAILHVDMDAFFVSVELARRPELRGRPVVVGGEGPRGVVAAASYEARRYGVFSAMPSTTARRLCPEAVFLPGDHAHYSEVSAQVHAVFREVTPLVEPIALDEAFLDVSGARRLHGDAPTIAARIRDQVRSRLGLECSVGVATNKFVAKVASKAAKPKATPAGVCAGAGVVEVPSGSEAAFLAPLPVRAVWGVGPATFDRLNRLGVRTVGDLAAISESALVASLGKAHGRQLFRLARGIDERPVEPDRDTKSIGHEETFARDLHGADEIHVELVRMSDAVAARLRAHGVGARTITLKLRFDDFTTISRAVTMPSALDTAPAILAASSGLLAQVDLGRGVRLVGVSASNFAMPAEQLTMDGLFDDAPQPDDWDAASDAIDEIRSRFGPGAIGPASVATTTAGLRVVRRGAQQWGPNSRG